MRLAFSWGTEVDVVHQRVPLIEGLMSHLGVRLFYFFSRHGDEGRSCGDRRKAPNEKTLINLSCSRQVSIRLF